MPCRSKQPQRTISGRQPVTSRTRGERPADRTHPCIGLTSQLKPPGKQAVFLTAIPRHQTPHSPSLFPHTRQFSHTAKTHGCLTISVADTYAK